LAIRTKRLLFDSRDQSAHHRLGSTPRLPAAGTEIAEPMGVAVMATFRSRWGILSAALTASALAASLSQAAVDPSDRCEGGKNDAAGKYAACMAKAEKSFVLGAGVGDYEDAQLKCSDKLSKSWEKFEAPAACPSMGDETAIRDYVDACVQSVAVALSGGSLPVDVAVCLADLDACDADLGTCNADLGGCGGDLSTAQADLATCNGDLGTCDAERTSCGDDLSVCDAGLGTCQSDLDTCNGDLGTCDSERTSCTDDLSACDAGLGTCQSDLDTCSADLLTAGADLTACGDDLANAQGDLLACNDDLGVCSGDLAIAQGELDTCNGEVLGLQGDLATCNDTLSTSQDDLATCNDDLSVCSDDLAACLAAPTGRPLQTGQTSCSDAAGNPILCAGTGQDAETQPGLVRSWTDNGDGTVTDDHTGLMWEKLSDDGSIHDKDNAYTWTNAVATKIAALNSALFAGPDDWRLPTITELQTLTDFGRTNPAINPTFTLGCAPGCNGVACSCTRNATHWSSTSYESGPVAAWCVQFSTGGIGGFTKTNTLYTRAVRSAS
jgi:hypothetical protein